MVLAIFSDGSCAINPERVYFVFYNDGEEQGPYVFKTISPAVETARESYAMMHRVRIEVQRARGGDQVVIWRSPDPVPARRPRRVR